MADTSKKIRGLFLATLMFFTVFSGIVAFSNGAAAAANINIEQAVEYDDGTIEVAFDSTSGDISDSQVTVLIDGEADTTASVGSDDGSNGRLQIGLDNDVTPNQNLTVKITGLTGGDGTVVAKDIVVTSTTIDSFSSSSVRSHNTEVYRGEAVAVVNDTTNGNVLVKKDEGSIVLDGAYADNGRVYVFDTGHRATGQKYDVSVQPRDDSAGEAGFRLNDHNLNVEADSNDTTDEDDLSANVTITRGGQPANAALLDDDGNKVDSLVKKRLSGTDSTAFVFGNISSYNGFDTTDGPYIINVTDNQTGATASTGRITVSKAQDGKAAFENRIVTDERGDVTNITVQVDNTDTAHIFIGDDDEENYAINATLTDEDDDGEITVQFNSYTAGDTKGDTVLSLPENSDDSLDVGGQHGGFANTPKTIGMLEAASYGMNVTAGASPSVGNADAVGILRLNERSTENVRVLTAPSGTDVTDDDISVYDRIGVNLTQSDDIAADDVVVHQITASGIEGALAAEDSDNATDAFLSATETETGTTINEPFSFTINKTNVGPNGVEKQFRLNNSNTDVSADSNNDTYFIAVDTSQLNYEDGTSLRHNDNTDELTANFSAEGPLTDSAADGVKSEFSAIDLEATLNTSISDHVTVSAAPRQEIIGTTTAAPGSEVTVQIESDSETHPFIFRPETTVRPDRTFTATQNFSDQSADVNFTVDVRRDSSKISASEENGQTVGVGTVRFDDQEPDRGEIIISSAQLSTGGFVTVHAGNASGDVIGRSEHLSPGSYEDVAIMLDEPVDRDTTAVAMLHHDADGNKAYNSTDVDSPYAATGSAVTDSAALTVGAREPTATGEPTETEEQTQEQIKESAMDAKAEQTEITEASGPGFTPATALIIIVAAAFLVVRRDN